MIELYIDKQLCDIENPKDFSLALKRQFLNPAELNTKDAQKSYDIRLPTTTKNNHIFGFKNIEEVKGKFVKIYDAVLIIKGVRIFTGKFRLSEITKDSYKGNLGVPAAKTIKEIFGETRMNEAGEWKVPFNSFPLSINEYNNMSNAPCIFPYVLYGLLPKRKSTINGQYSSKIIWDNSVVVALDDFPPSVNCLDAIENIFLSKGFTINGSAFNDDRLTRLYMSYKNPTDYELLWNYRGLVNLDLTGIFKTDWKTFYINDEKQVVNYDMLTNRRRDELVINDNKGEIYDTRTGIVTIPVSGVYEIVLDAEIMLDSETPIARLGKDLYQFPASNFEELKDKYAFELKLLKYSDADFVPTSIEIDRKFGKPNIYQNNDDWEYESQFPKLFPQPNKTMLIDASQNDKFVIGFGCGKDDLPEEAKTYYTPAPNSMILANGWSWNPEYSQTEVNYISSNIEGYLKADFDTDTNTVSIYESEEKKRVIDNFSPLNGAEYTAENKVKGYSKAYVYLKKGERLALISSSSIAPETITSGPFPITFPQVIRAHILSYNLKVKPIMYDKNFVNTIQDASDEYIDSVSDMLKDEIDLVKFLPSEQKVDDWLDNFCKAFNLQLSQTSEKAFELNVKQKRRLHNQSAIDLDKKANVNLDRKNSSLNLPSVYEIGFTVDQDEQGYVETGEDGSGTYYTGNTEGSPLNQKSSFSYNWFKEIEYEDYEGNIKLNLPVITNKEIWAVQSSRDYAEMMQKTYVNLAQRFWYKGDNFSLPYGRNNSIDFALVNNSIDSVINLNYKNRPFSILTNYFTVLVNNETDYTTVDCIITPEEYNRLPYSYVKFNGDLYYVAEIDKYDPTGRSKCTLKLIRKIL